MKKLTIEEKAKAYDEAIKVARSKIKNDKDHVLYEEDITDIFPVLKESEDEKIRKAIIDFFKLQNDNTTYSLVPKKDIIAWLEKQGEQNHVINIPKFRVGDNIKTTNEEPLTITKINDKGYWSEDLFICGFDDAAKWELVEQKSDDKVEPKFKVGDWITNGKLLVGQVTSFNGEYYHYMCDGLEQPLHVSNAYKWHLWTIQDVKNGDVLAINNKVFIYAHRKQLYSIAVAHCFIDSAGGFYFDGEFGYTEKGNLIHPATKEQRDLLFQKMKEAGYEWDAEKKELKKVEQKHAEWSEEDENAMWLLKDIVRHSNEINENIYTMPLKEKLYDFLKSLKDRYTWKPSEEQIKALEAMLTVSPQSPSITSALLGLYEQLKKLKGE